MIWEDVDITDALQVFNVPIRKYKVEYNPLGMSTVPIEELPLEKLRALYDNIQEHASIFGRNMALIFLSEIIRREIGTNLPGYNKYCEGHLLFKGKAYSILKITPL